MSVALPTLAHASRRIGARVVLSGALAVGLLTTAPADRRRPRAPPRTPSGTRTTHKPQKHQPQADRRRPVERAR